MIEIKQIKGGTDNCYLVTDGTRAILVDTASGQCLDQVIADYTAIGVKFLVMPYMAEEYRPANPEGFKIL